MRYGSDAIGGVIRIEPAPLRKLPGTNGEINLAAFSNNRMGLAEAMIEQVSKKLPALSVKLQGTIKQGGNYSIPDAWVANTGIAESNYLAAATWRGVHHQFDFSYSHFNTAIGIYKGSHTSSQADLLAAINSPQPLVKSGFTYHLDRPRQQVQHDIARARWTMENRAGLWTTEYAYQHNYRQEYDVVRTPTPDAQFNLTLNTQSLGVNLDHRSFHGFKGSVGVSAVYQDNWFLPGDRLLLPFYNQVGGGVYAIEHHQIGAWLLEGGLRFDYTHYAVQNPEGNNQQVVDYQYQYQNVSGTVGAQYTIRPDFTVKASVSTAWRAPQVAELFSAGLHQGAARVELGNKTLAPERAFGLNLESNWNSQNQKWAMNAVVYSQYIGNYIFLSPGADLLTIRGYYKTFHYQQTNAWLNGGDLSINYDWNKAITTTAKATVLRARDRSAKDWLILIPSDRYSISTKFTTDLSSVWKQCFVNVEARYVNRQNRIPENFDAIDFPRPPAGYVLLNASVGTQFMLRNHPIYVSVSATNLLNSRYREYLDAFRYYLNAPGTDVALRLRIPLTF